MLGWGVLGVSSALGDKATQYLSVSDSCSSPCREARAFLSGELGLPQEQRKQREKPPTCPGLCPSFGPCWQGQKAVSAPCCCFFPFHQLAFSCDV